LLQRYLEELTDYAATVVGDDGSDTETQATRPTIDVTSPTVITEPDSRNRQEIYSPSTRDVEIDVAVIGVEPANNTRVSDAAAVVRSSKGAKLSESMWDIGIPEKYARAGLESGSHKHWREEVVQIMEGLKNIPDASLGPKNGRDYVRGIDYTQAEVPCVPEAPFSRTLTLVTPIPPFPPFTEKDSVTHARLCTWLQHFTMTSSRSHVNFSVPCRSPDGRENLITPLTTALEIHNWEWLNALLVAGALPPTIPFINTIGDGLNTSYLRLALDWSLALFRELLTRLDLQYDHVMKGREQLNHTFDILVWEVGRSIRHSKNGTRHDHGHIIPTEDTDTLWLYAAEFIISIGRSRLDVNILVRIVTRHEALLVLNLLFDHNADPNHANKNGGPLHVAIFFQKWNAVALLVEQGADPRRRAILGLLFRSYIPREGSVLHRTSLLYTWDAWES
jgi:hypothetical protein